MKSIKRFTWIPFYEEMATKLLSFKDKRKELVDMVYATGFADYIKGVDSERVNDIDPFTVFGLFNRGLKNENRIKLAQYFKDKLGIEAEVPCDFDGIPVLNNQKATFFYREEIASAVQPLWDLFDAAISKDLEAFKRSFNIVRKQRGIKWNITMGLFWIRPKEYIALDSINRAYLELLGIDAFDEKHLNAVNYIGLLAKVRQKLGNSELSESSIPEISYKAWTSNGERNYWLLGYTFGGHDSQLERFFKDGVWEGRFDETNAASKAQLDLTQDMRDGDVIILKSVSTKGPKHDQPFIRIKGIGVIKGDVKTTDIEGLTSCQCSVEYVPMTEVDFDNNIYGAYQKTIHLAEKSKLPDLLAFVDSILSKGYLLKKLL